MARPRKSPRQAVRPGAGRLIPAWVWLTIGVVAGLGLAFFLIMAGVVPRHRLEAERPQPSQAPSEERADLSAQDEREWRPKYDFYTVLPEMEVVIPDDELKARVQRRETRSDDKGPYVIQVGSFKDYGDADRIKAELALLGIVAHLKQVQIDDDTWHRVRVGPFESLRETDQVKRQLQDNNFDALVLSEKS